MIPGIITKTAASMENNTNTKKREFWKPVPQTFSVLKAGSKIVKPYGVMDPYGVYTYIRDGVSREQTEKLRSIMDPKEFRKYKFNAFETALFSGVFGRKEESGLQKPTGYVCFDFNHVSVQQTKDILMGLEQFETILLFTSASGHGVKWVVNNNFVFKHTDFYNVVSDYLWEKYRIEADKNSSGIATGCLLPYDPEVYINPNYI